MPAPSRCAATSARAQLVEYVAQALSLALRVPLFAENAARVGERRVTFGDDFVDVEQVQAVDRPDGRRPRSDGRPERTVGDGGSQRAFDLPAREERQMVSAQEGVAEADGLVGAQVGDLRVQRVCSRAVPLIVRLSNEEMGDSCSSFDPEAFAT